jgi:sugar transferase (PEP-CTERM/EpsH1 system associated)
VTLTISTPSRPNLLYLVHRLPYPPDKGDRIRSFHVLRHLARHALVHLACLADEPVSPKAAAALEGYCARMAIVPLGSWQSKFRALASLARGRTATQGAFHSPALAATLRAWAGQTSFDAVLASASSMVPYLQMEELRSIPAVVDLVDVDSQKWLDYAAASWGPRRWLYRTEGRRLRQLERTLPSWARAVTLVSEAEADLYREFCAAGSVHAVANGVDLDYFQPVSGPVEPSCVFTGALDYRPNIDGLCWFCREVWPEIYSRRPDTKFYLVGRKPVRAIRRLAAQAGVVLIGQVPDVRPYLASAAVAVIPLRIARGLQNKILEALAMGKATVASPGCLAALTVEPGVHLLSAAAPREWTDAILRLLDDRNLREGLGASGRRYVEHNHRWESCLEQLASLTCFDSRAKRPQLAHKSV